MLRNFVAMGVCVVAGGVATGDVVEIVASKDNTLYQSPTGSLSNGAGSYLFAGSTASGQVRRSVLEFDVAGSIPAGSTISSAMLVLTMSRSLGGVADVGLYRCGQEWGEGGSNASGEEGAGAPAQAGDATWIHAIYEPGGGSVLWVNEGGDFEPGVSAVTSVGGLGFYSWSTAGTTADVQGWLNDPSSNHGWMLMGNEEDPASSKRFNSREFVTVEEGPRLVVNFTPPADCPADFNDDTMLNFFDVQAFLQAFSSQDPRADFNDDTMFNFFDVQAFLQAFSAGCP